MVMFMALWHWRLVTVALGSLLPPGRAGRTRSNLVSDGAWWAFMPATVLITVIVFALYVINTSMEGVFNPRLRK